MAYVPTTTPPTITEEAAQPGFDLTVQAPLFFNTNPQISPNGSRQTWEGDPDIKLDWTQKIFPVIQATGSIESNIDRYTHSDGADSDTADGKLKLQYLNGDDQQVLPYVGLRERAFYTPTYAKTTEYRSDINIGFDKFFAYQKSATGLERLAASEDSQSKADFLFGVTVTLQREFDNAPAWADAINLSDTANVLSAPSWAVVASPSLSYTFSHRVNVNIAADITRRWYDTQMGASRRDWEFEPSLTIEYDPPPHWFPGAARPAQRIARRLAGAPVIQFVIGYHRLASTSFASSYQQYTFGPQINFKWSF